VRFVTAGRAAAASLTKKRGIIMRALTRLALFALTGLVLLPAAASAQASITGVVRDTSGAVLPGVTVEATSPALIEKVRSAVSDGTGQYRIVDLRPGVYTVTFTLPGFSIVKREGIELEGVLTATVNADLRIGAVTETITVTGESPIVDVQSIRRQATVSGDVFSTLPSSRGYASVMQLIPSIIIQSGQSTFAMDVQVSPVMSVFGGAGGRPNEGRLQVDGINTGASVNGAGVSPYIADLTNAQEVTFTTSGGLGEAEVGGPAMNIVPKTGGNTVKGSIYLAGVTSGMVGDNYTQALKDAGLSAPGKLLKLWDFSGGLGGPIVKDRLWYIFTLRNEGSHRSVPGMFANKNAGDPTKWNYEPDLNRQSVNPESYDIANLRLTVQATPRNKFGLFWDEQIPCKGATWSEHEEGCRQQPASGFHYSGAQATVAPEAGGAGGAGGTIAYGNKFQRVQQATWSSPATNRLLLEAGFGTYLQRFGTNEQPGNPTRGMVRVTEQCGGGCAINGNIPGLVFRSQNFDDSWSGAHTWRASASYVTGAHNMKFGYQGAYHVWEPRSFTNDLNLQYQVNNGVPNQITQNFLPVDTKERVRYTALYAQEQWTRGRVTMQGAVRFDHAWSYTLEQRVGPTRFLPAGLVFEPTDGVNYKDITPRAGLAFDLFGNGKTSLKINAGKYLEPAAPLGIWSAANPRARIATSTTRSWNDANRNFVPDCDLLNPAAQNSIAAGGDSCGAYANQNFGKSTFSNSLDPELLEGWGIRGADGQIGVSIQHELLPRMSVEVGYYRRWLQNFTVNDNLSVTAANFDTFSVTAPQDPRLPEGGGYVISGLYNVTPTLFGQTNNFLTAAKNFGDQYQRYNGMLINVSARPRNGLTIQGGLNTGATVTDNCAVRAQLPELSPLNPYCHDAPGLVTRVTGLTAYTIPKIDVLVSGTFRSDQGPTLAANYAVPSAAIQPSLGRPLAGGAANATVSLVKPGEAWGDRINELNFRVAKVIRVGRTRSHVGLDLYNSLNRSAILAYNNSFVAGGSWGRPNFVLSPRFVKLSAAIDC
jgi:hypothetical protein